jgi:hypothetical protein
MAFCNLIEIILLNVFKTFQPLSFHYPVMYFTLFLLVYGHRSVDSALKFMNNSYLHKILSYLKDDSIISGPMGIFFENFCALL